MYKQSGATAPPLPGRSRDEGPEGLVEHSVPAREGGAVSECWEGEDPGKG